MARVLFLSYTGLAEPLSHSQVLPYLRALASRGYPSCLVTFEKPEHIDAAKFGAWRRELAEQGIEWHWLRYHKRPVVPATLLDVFRGIRLGSRLIRRHQIRLIHARASIAGLMGWMLAGLHRRPFIFDLRGLNAEEYVDGSGWSRSSLRYRALRWLECRMAHDSSALVVLTEWVRRYLAGGGYGRPVEAGKITVIPCCADLTKFQFRPEDRRRVREQLDLRDQVVLMYAGQAGTWYLLDEMAAFAATARRLDPSVRLVIVTPTEPGRVWPVLERHGWNSASARVVAASPEDMPAYLSAADVALSFIKPSLAKRSSSPTKIAEYLACGLPVVANAGVGDMERIFEGRRIGALAKTFFGEEHAAVWQEIETLRREGAGLQARCRQAAETLFDLHAGASRYAQVYQRTLKEEEQDGVFSSARAHRSRQAGEAELPTLRR